MTGHGAEGTVTVHSQGGLGNQLFIYATGLAAARRAGVQLRVDTSLHSRDPGRPFLLQALGLPAVYVDLSATHRPDRRLLRKALGGSIPPASCTYREPSFRYDPAALQQSVGGCMFGYFQSWRYLEPVAIEIRELLTGVQRRLQGPALAEVVARVSTPGAVVLHVRRGDYLGPNALRFHGLAGLSFYARAVEVLVRLGFNGPVLVFSDDVEASLEELAPLSPASAVGSCRLSPAAEILAMSAASSLVTANSSFSWWGAWAGERPGRPVLAPRPWFDAAEHDDRDLLPASWLSLGRDL